MAYKDYGRWLENIRKGYQLCNPPWALALYCQLRIAAGRGFELVPAVFS